MPSVMLSGPFSALMTEIGTSGTYRFAQPFRARIETVSTVLKDAGYDVFSAHSADLYGEAPWSDDFVRRDLHWAETCDVQLVLVPTDDDGVMVRSDGTMIELGFAHARDKPIILLSDTLNPGGSSFFFRSFAEKVAIRHIDWNGDFVTELLACLERETGGGERKQHRTRQQRSDVEGVLADLRAETEPHCVSLHGLSLTVLPGVLSPRLSHAPDALIGLWTVPKDARVLDLGCGCGVLGIAALAAGAASLVALDINPQAVANTNLNLRDLDLSDRGEARLSDAFSAVKPGEAFDLILFAAPYWNRKPNNDLDRSCYDDDYTFFQRAIDQAPQLLADGGRIYVIFSDQGDVGRAIRIIEAAGLMIADMQMQRPNKPGGHIRIIWELRCPARSETLGATART